MSGEALLSSWTSVFSLGPPEEERGLESSLLPFIRASSSSDGRSTLLLPQGPPYTNNSLVLRVSTYRFRGDTNSPLFRTFSGGSGIAFLTLRREPLEAMGVVSNLEVQDLLQLTC